MIETLFVSPGRIADKEVIDAAEEVYFFIEGHLREERIYSPLHLG